MKIRQHTEIHTHIHTHTQTHIKSRNSKDKIKAKQEIILKEIMRKNERMKGFYFSNV